MKKTTLSLFLLLFMAVMIVSGQVAKTEINKNDLLKIVNGQTDQKRRLNTDEMTALKNMQSAHEMFLRSKNPVGKTHFMKQMSGEIMQMLDVKSPSSQQVNPNYNVLPVPQKSKLNSVSQGMTLQEKLNNCIYRSASGNKAPQAGVMKHRLDSIVFLEYIQSAWAKDSKQVFEYNYNTRLTKNANFKYSLTGNNWINEDESKISYDEKGRMTGYVSKRWNDEPGNMRWVINDSINIQYDSNGNKVLDESYYESYDDISGKYVLAGNNKSEYIYDLAGGITTSIFYGWDTETGAWLPQSKHEVLIKDGIELMFAGYMWNPQLNAWTGHWKFEHFPVAGYNMMGSVYYSWNDLTNQWYVNSKEEYEISQNESGVVITSTYYQSDYDTNELYPYTKTVYSEPVTAGHNLQESFRSIDNYEWNPIDSQWINDTKTRNTFDVYGNLILGVDSVWAFNNSLSKNEWMIGHKTESAVNTAGVITETILSNWGYDIFSGTNTLTGIEKQLFTYDANKMVVERVIQSWDFSTETWMNTSKNTYAYDNEGNVLQEIWYENYVPETQSWIASRKFEYTYDNEGNEVSYAYYNWISDADSWRLGSKNEYDEDENGEVILDSYTNWNDFFNKEIINHKQQKVFDGNGNLVMEVNISSNIYFDGSLYYLTVNGEKQEYVFDGNNRLTSQLWYDYQNDQFVAKEKIDYTYDSNYPAAMSTETSYHWNVGTSAWDLSTKGELSYNFNVPKSEILLPFGDDENESRELKMYFNFMPLEFIGSEWNAVSSSWDLSEKTIVYYSLSEFSSTENVNIGHEGVIYPNPVKDYITVKLPDNSQPTQLKLFDVQGKLLNEITVSNGSMVDLSMLDKGLYFYQMSTPADTYKGKLIKR